MSQEEKRDKLTKKINIKEYSYGLSFSFDMGTAKEIGLIPAIVANFISMNGGIIGISGFLDFLTLEEIEDALEILKRKNWIRVRDVSVVMDKILTIIKKTSKGTMKEENAKNRELDISEYLSQSLEEISSEDAKSLAKFIFQVEEEGSVKGELEGIL